MVFEISSNNLVRFSNTIKKFLALMQACISSGSKLAVLGQSESAKEHGKGDRPSVVTALIRNIITGHVEVSLS